MCMRCGTDFKAITRRRHHCRACGAVSIGFMWRVYSGNGSLQFCHYLESFFKLATINRRYRISKMFIKTIRLNWVDEKLVTFSWLPKHFPFTYPLPSPPPIYVDKPGTDGSHIWRSNINQGNKDLPTNGKPCK